MTRVRLDGSARRSRDGRVLSGSHPARVVRLSAAGARALDVALEGADRTSHDLIERLTTYGLVHPTGDPCTRTAGRVTFVVPAKDCANTIAGLVVELLELGPVVVVDDRSTDDTAGAAERAGAEVAVNALAPGPAGARTTGLRHVRTDLVAFVDSDCMPLPGWLAPLVSLMDDQELALVAPRVASAPGTSALARYERTCSPLDLGPEPSLVSPGQRLTYVPSAALVGRTGALRRVDGFDPSLRYGEDVDLVLRLWKGNYTVRYAPESVVLHRPRQSLGALIRQRYSYGTSAAVLEQRHPGTTAPLRVSVGAATTWVSALAGRKALAAAVLATTLPAGRIPHHPTAKRHAVLLAARGHADATRFLARALAREWLPIAVPLSCSSATVRRVTLTAVATDVVAAWAARRDPPTPAFPMLRIIENAAYAAGLWRGAVRARSAAAVLPRLTHRKTRARRRGSGSGVRRRLAHSPATATPGADPREPRPDMR